MGWKEMPSSELSNLLLKDLPGTAIKELLSDNVLLINSDATPTITLASREVFKTFKELKNKGIQPLFMGNKIGVINNKRTELSINFATQASKYKVPKAFINDKAEQLFLYTRDIWSGSIIKTEGRVLKGKLTFIFNEKNQFLGLAFPINTEVMGKKEKTVLKHLLDIGDYLRCEK